MSEYAPDDIREYYRGELVKAKTYDEHGIVQGRITVVYGEDHPEGPSLEIRGPNDTFFVGVEDVIEHMPIEDRNEVGPARSRQYERSMKKQHSGETKW